MSALTRWFGGRLVRTGRLCRPLKLGSVVVPESLISRVQSRVARCRADGPVELLSQDVRVLGMPVGLGEDMDQDVEEHSGVATKAT